jgi:hypothetical protein
MTLDGGRDRARTRAPSMSTTCLRTHTPKLLGFPKTFVAFFSLCSCRIEGTGPFRPLMVYFDIGGGPF